MQEHNDPHFRAAYLGALLGKHYPDASPNCIAKLVSAMQAAAKSAIRWELRRCNHGMTETQGARGMQRLQRLQDAINADLVLLTPVTEGSHPPENLPNVLLGGDPRGSCASLHMPGLRGDGFGDGFAIY